VDVESARIDQRWSFCIVALPHLAEGLPQFLVRYSLQGSQAVGADADLIPSSLRVKSNGVAFVDLNVESA
jgi:hypothetical protein